MTKIFRKYKATAETRDGLYKVLQVTVTRAGREPLVAQFGGIKIAYNKDANVADMSTNVSGYFLCKRSQLIDRMLRDVCELCGATGDVEMHHVRKLRDLSRRGRRYKPEWMQRMIAMRRKTLAVCVGCHHEIHSGVYDAVRVH